jgi:chemotaxis methyl-accepting protein methylase
MFGNGEPRIFSFIEVVGLLHDSPWKLRAVRGFAQELKEDGASVSGTSESVNENLCQKFEKPSFSPL